MLLKACFFCNSFDGSMCLRVPIWDDDVPVTSDSVVVCNSDGKFASFTMYIVLTLHFYIETVVLGFTPSHYTVVEGAHVLVLFNISVIHGISQESGISVKFSTRNGSASCMCVSL